jgi:hypothetical protein
MKNRREVLNLAVGFVIGLLIGMILVGSSDDLRESLFGTAGDKEKKPASLDYYLVDLQIAQGWLQEKFPDKSEDLQKSISVLTTIPAAGFAFDYQAVEQDIQFLLPQAYAALVGEKDPANLKVSADDPIVACLGVDDDPYQGITMYLYVTIPSSKAADLEIPKEWEKLDEAKSDDLYWKLVGCFPQSDK